MADSTSLVLYDPRTADPEVTALAWVPGRLRRSHPCGLRLDLRQYLARCGSRQLRLFDAHRSDISCTPGSSKSGVGPAPPSAVACRPSPGSTATRPRRASSSTHRPCTSAGPSAGMADTMGVQFRLPHGLTLAERMPEGSHERGRAHSRGTVGGRRGAGRPD